MSALLTAALFLAAAPPTAFSAGAPCNSAEASLALPGTIPANGEAVLASAISTGLGGSFARAALASDLGNCKDAIFFALALACAGSGIPTADCSPAMDAAIGGASCFGRSVTTAPTMTTQATSAPQRNTGQDSQPVLTGTTAAAPAVSGCTAASDTISRQFAHCVKCPRICSRSRCPNDLSANAQSKFGSGCSSILAIACSRWLTILGISAICLFVCLLPQSFVIPTKRGIQVLRSDGKTQIPRLLRSSERQGLYQRTET